MIATRNKKVENPYNNFQQLLDNAAKPATDGTVNDIDSLETASIFLTRIIQDAHFDKEIKDTIDVSFSEDVLYITWDDGLRYWSVQLPNQVDNHRSEAMLHCYHVNGKTKAQVVKDQGDPRDRAEAIYHSMSAMFEQMITV